MTKTLHPEDRIAHYRVVGPLGVGGMGEVYLAQDQTLERNVALKVLPPALVRSEERVRRFVQEAKSASSLNHPNIVTIYEIGNDNVRSSSGSDTGPLQYISMELVSGKTLGAKIHEEQVDLRTLLGYLAQAAEGLAKAHAAGIVHRDLKPGNIMVSDDGFTKVLDFGLAKLTEKHAESASASALTEAELTSEGTVLGTVHYMSPEQVQGKSVDHRSDIFSFGCLLYEAATRRRPFVADSNVETMHKILHDKPAPIEESNPQAPAELRRLVRRCLAKSPDQRLQSMKDLAIELREIVDEYDTLSVSTASGTSTGSGAAAAIPARRSWPVGPIVVAALVIAAAGIGFGVWTSRREAEPTAMPFQNMRATTITSRGDVNFGALSPDGRYFAYIAGTAGRSTLRVRQVATGSDVEVLPVQDTDLQSPSFSPDGNYLFFLKFFPEQPMYRTLVRVPSLGGPEEQKGFDVDSRVTFSPDAKRVCFVRGVPTEGRFALIVRDVDAGTERELATVSRPEGIAGSPSWSPDGKRIAVFTIHPAPKSQSTLVMFDAETGEREDFLTKKGSFFVDVAWVPDGRGLVAAGAIISAEVRSQVYMVTYPRPELRRVTNDFNAYGEVSAAAGAGAIGALRTSTVTNLYIADPTDESTRRLTSATSPEQSPFGLAVLADRVVFPAVHGGRLGISAIPFAGGEPRRLAVGPGHATNVIARNDRTVFQRVDEDGQQHLWRMGVDGTDLKQITGGAGEELLDVSPDGSQVLFTRSDSTLGVWMVSSNGGEATRLAPKAWPAFAAFSLDGKDALTIELQSDTGGLVRAFLRILRVDTGEEVARFVQPPEAIDPQQGGDREMTFLDRDDPARNIHAKNLASGARRQITNFTDGRLTIHRWSPDQRHIAMVRHDAAGDNVWVVEANGTSAKQITRFDGQVIFEIAWTLDNQRVVVRAGTSSRDVVLISNFQ